MYLRVLKVPTQVFLLDRFFTLLGSFLVKCLSLAIPLVALNYHNVEIRINWASAAANYNVECFANYYYLDTEERGQVASRKHDILITQVQKSIRFWN